MDVIEGVRKTTQGYTQVDGEYLHLSVINGNQVEITYNGSTSHDIVGRTEFFNNNTAAVTIAAHETHDLFKWSKRFVDDDHLVFTWLVEPREGLSEAGWLRYAAAGVAVSTIVGMLLVLKKEGLGPLAKGQNGQNTKAPKTLDEP